MNSLLLLRDESWCAQSSKSFTLS